MARILVRVFFSPKLIMICTPKILLRLHTNGSEERIRITATLAPNCSPRISRLSGPAAKNSPTDRTSVTTPTISVMRAVNARAASFDSDASLPTYGYTACERGNWSPWIARTIFSPAT